MPRTDYILQIAFHDIISTARISFSSKSLYIKFPTLLTVKYFILRNYFQCRIKTHKMKWKYNNEKCFNFSHYMNILFENFYNSNFYFHSNEIIFSNKKIATAYAMDPKNTWKRFISLNIDCYIIINVERLGRTKHNINNSTALLQSNIYIQLKQILFNLHIFSNEF